MPRVRAKRVVSTLKRGSSWPVVVETDSGRFVTKLRGAAQGVPALIAEVIAAELATIAGLPVPERVIVELEWPMPSDLRVDSSWRSTLTESSKRHTSQVASARTRARARPT